MGISERKGKGGLALDWGEGGGGETLNPVLSIAPENMIETLTLALFL